MNGQQETAWNRESLPNVHLTHNTIVRTGSRTPHIWHSNYLPKWWIREEVDTMEEEEVAVHQVHQVADNETASKLHYGSKP